MLAGTAALIPYRDARDFVLSRAHPVAARPVPLADAQGKALAERIVAASPVPPHPLAARRGIAVSSRELIGASPYSPVFLASRPVSVMPGDRLPEPADAVIEEQAVASSPGLHEIGQGAYPGEGAVLPGSDCPQGTQIAAAGATVTPAMMLALALSGITTLPIHSPAIDLGNTDGAAPAETAWLWAALRGAGCGAGAPGKSDIRVLICRDPAGIEVPPGGQAVAGLALNPGRDTRILWDGERLTFVLASRFDAIAACFYALILPAVAKMTGRHLRSVARPLAAKLVSQVGLADLAFLRSHATGYEPLATGQLSLDALIHADSIGIIDPESEGAPAGAAFSATPLQDPFEPL